MYLFSIAAFVRGMRAIDMLIKFLFIAGSQPTNIASLRQIIILFCNLTDVLNVTAAQIMLIKIGSVNDLSYFNIKIANMTFYRIPIVHPTTYLSHYYLLKFMSSRTIHSVLSWATCTHNVVWRSVPKLQQAVGTVVIFIAEKFYHDSTFKYYNIHNNLYAG
jgi:hypothetical protein